MSERQETVSVGKSSDNTTNAVLSYVVYTWSKAARDNLITVLDNEFCDEEVSEAK